ncbi:hypothetical protein FNV43_RR04392 [Rhamnella rubrinervis]|uniref:Uncharacterized protein n=1 Tax=Rhamnella rubrinervis TaxID=2594499 RepID=A0A8K0MQJ5_9ROSA|nr:hypothetical protein FNV43_RR04392 [Rhamnella rubrinervis]
MSRLFKVHVENAFPIWKNLGGNLQGDAEVYHFLLYFAEEFMEEDEVEKVMTSIRRLESLQSFKIRKYSTNPMEQDLEGILKIKIPKARLQPHELKVVAGEFSQLQVLKLRNLIIKTLEMEKDTMANLESLFIDSCDLEYLPEDDLLCRSILQLVEVIGWKVQDKLKTMLTYFKIKHPDTPCKINFTER